ncbi:hypothetical protein Hesp01_19130 [Herbidospora sp. NBRC 101105]|nr:hypothetical protein Hesp01_19130 [Herbidospora sp. NBRC 101105]
MTAVFCYAYGMQRLKPLIGEWAVTTALPGGQVLGRVRSTFAWLDDRFVVQRTDVFPGDQGMPELFPAVCVYGSDDGTGRFTQLYSDGRGVHRVYQCTFDDGVWTMWRDQPGFAQRFTATVGADVIDGGWELAEEEGVWKPDLSVRYERAGRPA